MSSNKKKRQNQRPFLAQPLVMVVVVLLCILLILSLRESSHKAQLSKTNLEENQANVGQLESQHQAKLDLLEQSQNDLYKEKIQRNELLQQKEGEITIQLPDVNPNELDLKATEANDQSWRNNRQAWFNLLVKQ